MTDAMRTIKAIKAALARKAEAGQLFSSNQYQEAISAFDEVL